MHSYSLNRSKFGTSNVWGTQTAQDLIIDIMQCEERLGSHGCQTGRNFG